MGTGDRKWRIGRAATHHHSASVNRNPLCWQNFRAEESGFVHSLPILHSRLFSHCRFSIPDSRPASIAHLFLAVFPAFLGVQTEGGDGAGIETIEADVFIGFLAEAVTTFLDALERLVDLRDELAIAVTRAQFQGVFGFPRGALGLVADIAHFVAQVL